MYRNTTSSSQPRALEGPVRHRANPTGGMSSLAEGAEVKTEPEDHLDEEDEDEDEDEAGSVAPTEADDPLEDPGLDPELDPGVTLVGREVHELKVCDANGEFEDVRVDGTVVGSRPHEHWGGVYDVAYPDGKRRELILEELLLLLWKDETLMSRRILDARERAQKQTSPGAGFVGASKQRAKLGNGVRRDDDLQNRRPLFYAMVSATHAKTRTFDVLFNKPEGAAAAFDLLVRRLHAVATRTMKRKKQGRCLVTFHDNQLHRLNFPKATASDLCGIVHACKAGGEADFKSADELRAETAAFARSRGSRKSVGPKSVGKLVGPRIPFLTSAAGGSNVVTPASGSVSLKRHRRSEADEKDEARRKGKKAECDDARYARKPKGKPKEKDKTACSKGCGKCFVNQTWRVKHEAICGRGNPKAADSGGETATASGGAAAAPSVAAPPPATSRIADDLEFFRSQLAKLREMLNDGTITEADYERVKSHLIQEMYPGPER